MSGLLRRGAPRAENTRRCQKRRVGRPDASRRRGKSCAVPAGECARSQRRGQRERAHDEPLSGSGQSRHTADAQHDHGPIVQSTSPAGPGPPRHRAGCCLHRRAPADTDRSHSRATRSPNRRSNGECDGGPNPNRSPIAIPRQGGHPKVDLTSLSPSSAYPSRRRIDGVCGVTAAVATRLSAAGRVRAASGCVTPSDLTLASVSRNGKLICCGPIHSVGRLTRRSRAFATPFLNGCALAKDV